MPLGRKATCKLCKPITPPIKQPSQSLGPSANAAQQGIPTFPTCSPKPSQPSPHPPALAGLQTVDQHRGQQGGAQLDEGGGQQRQVRALGTLRVGVCTRGGSKTSVSEQGGCGSGADQRALPPRAAMHPVAVQHGRQPATQPGMMWQPSMPKHLRAPGLVPSCPAYT